VRDEPEIDPPVINVDGGEGAENFMSGGDFGVWFSESWLVVLTSSLGTEDLFGVRFQFKLDPSWFVGSGTTPKFLLNPFFTSVPVSGIVADSLSFIFEDTERGG